jgi:hypothetical protein
MKKEKFDFGRRLSRDEMKKVRGGESICPVGKVALCYCNDPNWVMCVFGDGHSTPAMLCASTNACGPHLGLNHDSGSCQTNCPPPGGPQ